MTKKNIRQVIRGEYVATPIKNAFNNKTSYWMSKDGCTVAMYMFTVEGQGETTEEFEERLSEEGFKREIPRFEELCRRKFDYNIYREEQDKTSFNDNEKEFINKLNEAKNYVKGELELDCFNDRWYAMDYRKSLGGAFDIENEVYNKPIITNIEAKEKGINVIKCCDYCDISYVG